MSLNLHLVEHAMVNLQKPVRCKPLNSTLKICNDMGMDNELHPTFKLNDDEEFQVTYISVFVHFIEEA